MKIIYSMWRAIEVSVHRACCEQASQPYSLGWGVWCIQAQDQQELPYIVREWWLFTRSMLIKMYLPFHGMCLYMYIVVTVSQFHSLFSLSNCIIVSVWHNNSIRKYENEFLAVFLFDAQHTSSVHVFSSIWDLLQTGGLHQSWFEWTCENTLPHDPP